MQMYHYAIFSGVLWLFTLVGIISEVVDIRRRAQADEMSLDEYHSPRPIEWLFAAMLMSASAAAIMGSIDMWEGERFGVSPELHEIRLVTAGALVVILIYFSARGKIWFNMVKRQFIRTRGTTTTFRGQVLIDLQQEAEYHSRIMRRAAWIIYGMGCLPALLPLLTYLFRFPWLSVPVLLALLSGAGIVWIAVLSLPGSDTAWD